MAMKPPAPAKPVARGGVSLPPGSRNVPGIANYRRLQGAEKPPHKTIDKSFVADPRGGPELKVGKSAVHVKDNRSDPLR
jgi:hypothetical protein